jgi:hypothetical protein
VGDAVSPALSNHKQPDGRCRPVPWRPAHALVDARLGMLESRLRCGSRRVRVAFSVPAALVRMSGAELDKLIAS